MINVVRVPVHGQERIGHFTCQIQQIERFAYLAGIKVEHVGNSSPVDPLIRKIPGKDHKVWTGTAGAPNIFSIQVDKTQVIIDFADLMREGIQKKRFSYYPLIFKYHYYDECDSFRNVFPLISALDIKSLGRCREFFSLCHAKIYNPHASDLILNNQRAHTRALNRRTYVQSKLKEIYREKADTSFKIRNQEYFWTKLKDCFISIVVPGACNYMIDRGHLEQLALGICTLCPNIFETFPFTKHLKPWTHYVPCADDYSDLVQKIEWCKKNRDTCKEIGNNAYDFYWKYCSPVPYWKWIDHVITATKGKNKKTRIFTQKR